MVTFYTIKIWEDNRNYMEVGSKNIPIVTKLFASSRFRAETTCLPLIILENNFCLMSF